MGWFSRLLGGANPIEAIGKAGMRYLHRMKNASS